MVQPPRALGLYFCDQVIFERKTDKPSLIGIFEWLQVPACPFLLRSLNVFASLTDGLGKVPVDLVITALRTEQEVWSHRTELVFPDPLRILYARFRLNGWRIPELGSYLVSLLVEGEELAQRRLHVRPLERQP